jgi:hypothetical protein
VPLAWIISRHSFWMSFVLCVRDFLIATKAPEAAIAL